MLIIGYRMFNVHLLGTGFFKKIYKQQTRRVLLISNDDKLSPSLQGWLNWFGLKFYYSPTPSFPPILRKLDEIYGRWIGGGKSDGWCFWVWGYFDSVHHLLWGLKMFKESKWENSYSRFYCKVSVVLVIFGWLKLTIEIRLWTIFFS